MHFIEPIRDACSHALLETFRCTAKTGTHQPWMGSPKCRHFSQHGSANNFEQIAGQRRVGLEAEEYVAGYLGIPRDPDFAVTESGDCRDAAVDRAALLAADRHLDLDAGLLANIDLLHRERVPLKQPADHPGS